MASVTEQLQAALPDLSKNERRVAEYLLKYPHDVRRFTCETIAASCETSRSAVIRLCKKLGYHGYAELRYALLAQPSAPVIAAADADTALDRYAYCIQQLKNTVSPEKIAEIAELILHANRVVTFGLYHSFLSAKQMAFRLNRIYIDSHAVTDTSIMDNYTNILKQGDLVLIFSISGHESYLEYVSAYRQNRADVVLFTMTPQSMLAKRLNHIVALPFASHFSGIYLMDDAITFFLVIEMLIEVICKKLAPPSGELAPGN